MTSFPNMSAEEARGFMLACDLIRLEGMIMQSAQVTEDATKKPVTQKLVGQRVLDLVKNLENTVLAKP